MFSLSCDVRLLCKGYYLLYDTLTSTSKVIVGAVLRSAVSTIKWCKVL